MWTNFVPHIVDTIGNANQEAIRFVCVREMKRQNWWGEEVEDFVWDLWDTQL